MTATSDELHSIATALRFTSPLVSRDLSRIAEDVRRLEEFANETVQNAADDARTMEDLMRAERNREILTGVPNVQR